MIVSFGAMFRLIITELTKADTTSSKDHSYEVDDCLRFLSVALHISSYFFSRVFLSSIHESFDI